MDKYIIKKRIIKQYIPLIFLIIGILYCILNLAGKKSGLSYDEPYYIYAGALYAGIMEPEVDTEDGRWEYGHEHPPLAKMLMGFTQQVLLIFDQRNEIILIGSRVTVYVLFVFLLIGVYLLAKPLGETVAVMAVFFCLACPRLMGHARLATLDIPLTCFWVWSLAAFERAFRPSFSFRKLWIWRIIAVFLFGCASLTKFTGFALAGPFCAWVFFNWLTSWLFTEKKWHYNIKKLFYEIIFIFIGIGIVFAMLVIFWPWMWHDTWKRLLEYLSFSSNHIMASVQYFGTSYGITPTSPGPPWHYPYVMLALTTPVIITIGVCLLLILNYKKLIKNRVLPLIVFGSLVLPCCIMLPNATVYDGVRHFLPTVPLVCILASVGWKAAFDSSSRFFSSAKLRLCYRYFFPLFFSFGTAVIIQICTTCDLCFYTLAIGGPPGAVKLGFDPVYWSTPATKEAIHQCIKRMLAKNFSPDSLSRIRIEGFGDQVEAVLTNCGYFPPRTRFVKDNSWGVAFVVERVSSGHNKKLLKEIEENNLKVITDTISAQVWPSEKIHPIKVYWNCQYLKNPKLE